MLHRVSIICVIGLMVMVLFPLAGMAESEGRPAIGMFTPEAVAKGESVPPKTVAAIPAPALQPSSGFSPQFWREVPSIISGQYSIGGTTVTPFLGAGFSGGYISDVDRSIRSGFSTPVDSGLRSWVGQSLVPNEFRLGIRIPF